MNILELMEYATDSKPEKQTLYIQPELQQALKELYEQNPKIKQQYIFNSIISLGLKTYKGE